MAWIPSSPKVDLLVLSQAEVVLVLLATLTQVFLINIHHELVYPSAT